MKTKRIQEERLIISAAVFIFAATFFAGTIINRQNSEINKQTVHEQLLIEDRETKQEIEAWMNAPFTWEQTIPKSLHNINLSTEVTENHFELINGRMENLFTSEPDPEIDLEDWMLHPHEFKKAQGI